MKRKFMVIGLLWVLLLLPCVMGENLVNWTYYMSNGTINEWNSVYGEMDGGSVFRANFSAGRAFFNVTSSTNYTFDFYEGDSTLNGTDYVGFSGGNVEVGTVDLVCNLTVRNINLTAIYVGETSFFTGDTFNVTLTVTNNENVNYTDTMPFLFQLENSSEGWSCGGFANTTVNLTGGESENFTIYVNSTDCTDAGWYDLTVGIADSYNLLGNVTCNNTNVIDDMDLVDYYFFQSFLLEDEPVRDSSISNISARLLEVSVLIVILLLVAAMLFGDRVGIGRTALYYVVVFSAVMLSIWYIQNVL